ncbi:AMP-dependent synthetase [Chromobacterium phragmitis]|uniref:AMP-dependent synthetase n=1 Tax=Chromobacterium phragmitis TaxID=2202141 RepID=A0A344UG82_9NEIS|nr:AMP-binding protein [Chromobacterium phragmitis]AXE28920.1 AMP-dependent synthetase [Chromobacterium phragmitis]AXE34280.1 AMP-dependent synthetase [Chromobacterium phragmitis]
MSLSHQLHQQLLSQPEQTACVDHDADGGFRRRLSRGELAAAAHGLADSLRAALPPQSIAQRPVVGIVIRNSGDWVIADLACLFANLTSLPLPQAFTRAQAEHLAAKCDFFLLDEAGEAILERRWGIQPAAGRKLRVDQLAPPSDAAPDAPPSAPDGGWICKTIHTSGTTSRPKGVCLSENAIAATLASLREALPAHCHRSYLSLVPLSLLLEQITAVYLPLLSGGAVHFLPESVPLLGEPGGSADRMLDWLARVRPGACTVPPVVASRLLARLEQNDAELADYLASDAAPHITCGGAAVSAETLSRLAERGVPVFQGYGLSENASVVSVNTPAANRHGSVGRPLPHVRVRIAADGGIQIRSASLFSHYSGEDPSACAQTADGWLDTGDLGELDADGYLFISGRKKNVICLPNGRNVSPEQVELELRQLSGIHDAAVFLDDEDGLVALLHTAETPDPAPWLRWMADNLSDIERPARLWLLPRGNELLNRLYTVTGRPQRGDIAQAYAARRGAHSTHEENSNEHGRLVAI